MFRRLVIVAAVLLAARTAGAQVSRLPPRDLFQPLQPGTAAIKGRVVDGQTGSPVPRALVQLRGPGDLRPTVLTEEAGTFEFTALPAGLYWLTADKASYLLARYPESAPTLRNSPRPFPLLDGQVLDSATLSLFHGSAISGRVVDSHGEPVEFANVQVMRLPRRGGGHVTMRGGATTNDLGEFRVARLEAGSYLLLAQPRRNAYADSETRPVPTFYPGSLMREQAVPITIERGGSVTGLELALVDGTMNRVTGTVLDSSGRPAPGGFVNVRAIVEGVPDGLDTADAAVKPDGRFELTLAQGEYQIEARVIRPGTVGPLQSGDEQVGMARLTVTREAHSDLTIVLGAGAKVAGRVVFEGSTPPPVPSNPGQFRVSFASPEGRGCRMGRTELHPDWTFSVDGLLGSCIAQVNSSLGQLSVKAVMAGDVDLLDRPVMFESGRQLRNVEVLVTSKRTDLTFQVADDRGEPTREYVALVFPVDRARWVEGSRYIRPFVPAPLPPEPAWDPTEPGAPGGAFAARSTATPGRRDSLTGLPQGDYYVVAVDDLDVDAVGDPSVLESLSRTATLVTLTDRTVAEVSLRRLKTAGQSAER
jgi:Carboxypeptidase regulatory-like domain